MNDQFLKSINFRSGVITYNDFDIDPLIPLIEQEFSLKEDILQVDYGPYLLDLGWNPDCNVKGKFVVRLIHNYDWQNPIQRFEAKDLATLKERLQEVIDHAEALLSRAHA